MKRLLLIAAVVTFSVTATFAQVPTQPTHEKVVYLNDGNTYVQKSLPLYLKFSTTPDGKNYDLKSKATAEYTDPMYLDTEGVNYIRSRWAVNKDSKKPASPQKEILYELYADGLAPRTSISFTGAPRYVRSGTVYYGKGLSVSLTSRDAVSGVAKTHYALNASSYSDYSSPLSLDSENTFNLYYYAHDNVGNAEAQKNKSFVVDLTSPSTNSSIDGIVYNSNIIAPSTKFKLSSSDEKAGVRTVYYSFDDGPKKVFRGTIPVSYLSDGDHKLNFYSVDNVKNEEVNNTFDFYLDKIAPKVTHTINGDQYKGKYTYVSARTTVSLAATDNKAGVNKIYYRIDGKERFDYSNDIAVPSANGLHTFKYDATDNVQNLSGNTFLTLYVDSRNPETGINYGSPQFFNRDTLFINKTTDITLIARDYQSGVQKVEYDIDGSGYKAYSKFQIAEEGYHTISFKTTDNVNNEESAKTSNVYVDNTAPEIYHNFSIQPIGTKSKGGEAFKVYPNYTRIYLGATDDHVGTASIMYSMNDGPLIPYSSSQTLDISELNRLRNKKFYTVRVVAKDKLGNETEEIIKFYVGRQDDGE